MITVKNISKQYKGNKNYALKNISFTIRKGEFVALLGPNGAGKTTMINILAGHVIKSGGTVHIGSYDLSTHELETKNIIGVVPQEIAFDSFFTVNEVLVNQSGFFGIYDNQTYIDYLLKRLSLFDKKNVNTRKLSGGMKRRLLIAKALIHKPEVVILDEPTAGVDIELRQDLYELLRTMHRDGLTIILTTHYLEEAESLCDRIIIIHKGEMLVDKEKSDLLDTLGGNTLLTFTLNSDISDNMLSCLRRFKPQRTGNKLQMVVFRKELQKVFDTFSSHGITYESFTMREEDLEDIFIKLVRNKEAS